MCATMVDEDRFRKILTEKIENGQLKSYKKFTNESTASKKKRMDKVIEIRWRMVPICV